jgi:hypothetical protein
MPDAAPAGVVAIAGSEVASALAVEERPRPHVVIVASGWGANWGERAMATRLLAGALALEARVSVVSLDTPPALHTGATRLRYDGIFAIHSTAAPSAARDLNTLLRASLRRQPGALLPEVAARSLLDLESQPSSDALVTVVGLKPDVVILAGIGTLWLGEALPVGPARPKVVVLPLVGNDPLLAASVFRPLLGLADGIGTFSDTETHLAHLHAAEPSRVRRLRLSLPVNKPAAASGLAGVASFGSYVLVVSGFPEDDPEIGRCPPHEFLTRVLGGVSVAEMRHGRWLVSEAGRHFDVVFSPTRMNAWRLMARAIATIDVRPGGPIGREAIESLLLGTPVVVPEGTVAAEHAAASNGGLWYRTAGEMVDAARELVTNEPLRTALGTAGREWAERNHNDMDGFVEDAQALVLGHGA